MDGCCGEVGGGGMTGTEGKVIGKSSFMLRQFGKAASPSSLKWPPRLRRKSAHDFFSKISEIKILKPRFRKKGCAIRYNKSCRIKANINSKSQNCPKIKL